MPCTRRDDLEHVKHPVLKGAALAVVPTLVPGLSQVAGPAGTATAAVVALASPWLVSRVLRSVQPWLLPSRLVQAGMADEDEALRRQWAESTRQLRRAGTVADRLVVVQVRRLVHDPLIDTGISFVIPFAAYLVAEEIEASCVIAVVVAGLLIGHKAPIVQTSASRITERVTWASIAYLLEHAVFLLIGLQAASIVAGLDGSVSALRAIGFCLAVLAAAGREETRFEATRALAVLADPRGLPYLLRGLVDANPALRTASARVASACDMILCTASTSADSVGSPSKYCTTSDGRTGTEPR